MTDPKGRDSGRIGPERDRPARRKRRTHPAERSFLTAVCDVCGLTEYDAPVASRWVRGVPMTLCHGCWRAPREEDRRRLDEEVTRRERADGPGARLDRAETAIDLAGWAAFYVSRDGGRAHAPDLDELVAEVARVRAVAADSLGTWRSMRAARGAHRRGLVARIDETLPQVDPFLDLERDALARDLFGGYFRSLGIPAEYEDWVFDSAAAGRWLPVSPDPKRGYRIEPRIGGYLDHARHMHPPCVTWGRHTTKADRGGGRWVGAQNRLLGWDTAKKVLRDVELAPKEDQEFLAALTDLARTEGLPTTEKPGAPYGIDREELKYRLHRRLCDLCAAGTGSGALRMHGRKTHLFRCLDRKGIEMHPRLSWIDDQLAKPWNDRVLFWTAMRGTAAPHTP